MKMSFKWNYIYFGLFIQLVAGQVGDVCFVNEDVYGICLEVLQCDVALRSIVKSGSSRLPRCGFQGYIEIICCPKKTNPGNRVADRECKNIAEQYGPPTGTKVISGNKASEGEFPHMVAVFFTGQYRKYNFLCGGSLISDRHILTAAHCVENKQRSNPAFARVGVLDISDATFNDSTDYIIDQSIIHPEFKKPSVYHDLAILRLKEPVVMSDLVFPLCLYTKDEDLTLQVEVTGWGVNNYGSSKTSNFLLKGKLPLVSNVICNRSYKVSMRFPQGITSTQICAHDVNKKVDACTGDSGGPLQGMTENDSYYRLIGVTSHGNGCATSAPGVYTRINKYLDWIESVVWPSSS